MHLDKRRGDRAWGRGWVGGGGAMAKCSCWTNDEFVVLC